MAIKETERIGVFSESTVSKEVMGFPGSCYPIGIVAQVDPEFYIDSEGKVREVEPIAIQIKEDAYRIFGRNSEMSKLVEIVTLLGVNKIVCVPVVPTKTETGLKEPTQKDYKESLDILYLEEIVEIVITDSIDPKVHLDIRDHCDKSELNRRERRAHLGSYADSIAEWTKLAKSLNSGNITIWASIPLDVEGEPNKSSIYLAAACAALDSRELDPAMPLHNLQLHPDLFGGLYNRFDDEDYEALYGNGISACRAVNGKIFIDRWVTTYTEDDSVSPAIPDNKFQEGTVAKVKHYIDKGMRSNLVSRHPRSKASESKLGEVKSDSTIWLENQEEKEIIENPKVYRVERQKDKRTRFHVYYSYSVVLPLNTIFLHGHALV